MSTTRTTSGEFYTYLKQKYKLSNDDMGEFLESFMTINRGESITPDALKAFVEDEMDDTDWHIDDCRKIIANINKKVNGKPKNTIDLKTYLTYLIPLCCNHVITKIGLREIFDTLDSDFDGKITCEELVSLLYKVNKQFEPSELLDYKKQISRLCISADKDNDGFISYEEFKSFIIEMGMGMGKDNLPVTKPKIIRANSAVGPIHSSSTTVIQAIGNAFGSGGGSADSSPMTKRKDSRTKRKIPIDTDENLTEVAISIENDSNEPFHSSAANTFKKRFKRFSDKRHSNSADKKRYSFPQLALPELTESYAKTRTDNNTDTLDPLDSSSKRRKIPHLTMSKNTDPELDKLNNQLIKNMATSKSPPIQRRHSDSNLSTERRSNSDSEIMVRHKKPVLRNDFT